MSHYKRVLIYFVMVLLFENRTLFALDQSALYIDLLTSNPPNSSIIVIDPLGRKTGVKEFTLGTRNGIGFEEIPNSYEGYEGSPANDITGEPAITGRLMIGIIKGVSSGIYHLMVFSSSNTTYGLNIRSRDSTGKSGDFINIKGFISVGATIQYNIPFDPTPGAPAPVLTKIVTFQTLRDDIEVAYKLNQIGDEKFKDSLVRIINIAEKIYNRCGKIEDKLKDKDKNKDEKIKKMCYKPVVAILRMMVKRLEVVNKLCDNKTECKPKCKVKTECDEDGVFSEFDTKYRKDKDFKEFFDEWVKDEWHKHKKECKRFVTDEALGIISSDVNWHIKGLGNDIWQEYKKEHNPYIHSGAEKWFK